MILVNHAVRIQLTICAQALVLGYAKPCLDEVNQSPAPQSDGGADQQRISALAGLDSAPVISQRLPAQARARAKAAGLGGHSRLEPEQHRPGAGVWVEPGAGEAVPGAFGQAEGGKQGPEAARGRRLSEKCQKYLLTDFASWVKHLTVMRYQRDRNTSFEFPRKREADGSYLSYPACRVGSTAGAFFVGAWHTSKRRSESASNRRVRCLVLVASPAGEIPAALFPFGHFNLKRDTVLAGASVVYCEGRRARRTRVTARGAHSRVIGACQPIPNRPLFLP